MNALSFLCTVYLICLNQMPLTFKHSRTQVFLQWKLFLIFPITVEAGACDIKTKQ